MPVANSIDPEWANSVVGLRVKVPNCWWPGYNGKKLHPGSITAVNMKDKAGRYFMFETDADKGVHYPMRYDAVREYADKRVQSPT